jgi:hypothetical protein
MRGLLLLIGAFLVTALIALPIDNTLHGQDSAAPADEPPPVPKGVEVLARGPIHEAFATPSTEPAPTIKVDKQPPKPLDELPPEVKPEGNVIWIGGYYAFDDDRKDFLWVSGTWRAPPPNKQWTPGYWKEDNQQWQWVPGFWSDAPKTEAPAQDVTYMPEPPAAPVIAAPKQAPAQDTFYVPGYWVWNDGRYRWRDGYWARVQPGYVWVAAHYQWTPAGYVFVPGYWDIAIAKRGVLYAPVYVSSGVVEATFVYTPAYAVPDTVVVDALFVRPSYCHYYYGDYYEVRYRDCGYTSCVVYSQSHYDSVVVYETYSHRSDPAWLSIQIDLSSRRTSTPDLRPPSTSITNVTYNNVVVNNSYTNINNTNVNNTNINKTTSNVYNTTNVNKNTTNTFLMPAQKLTAAQGVKTVKLDNATRMEAKQQAQQVQQVAMKRTQTETPPVGGKLTQPKVQSLPVAPVKPVGVAAKPNGFSSPAGSNAGKTAPSTSANGIKQAAGTTSTSPSANVKPATKTPDSTNATRVPSNFPNLKTDSSLPGSATKQPLKPTTPSTTGRPMPPPPSQRQPPPKSDSDKDKDKKKPGQSDR